MQIAVWLIVGFFATWRITFDLTSSIELEGPFGLYEWLRTEFQKERWPAWIRNGIDCPYCVSFWIGHIVALFLPIYSEFSWLAAVGVYLASAWGMSGAYTLYLRRQISMYQIEAKDV